MQERPGLITTIGIFTIIVGSLGLLLYCMCSIRVLILISPDPNVADKLADLRSVPGYVSMEVITFIVNLVVSSLLLTGGIGLLLMGQWARVLTLIAAFMTLLTHLGTIIYLYAVVRPALARLPRNVFREGIVFFFDDQTHTVMTVGIGTLEILYSISTIVILLLPGITRAFADAARYGRQGRYGDRRDYRPPPPRNRYDEDW